MFCGEVLTLEAKYSAMASTPFLQTSIGGRSIGLPSMTDENMCRVPQSRFRSWPKRFGSVRRRLLPSHNRWRLEREQSASGRRSNWLKNRTRDSRFRSLDMLSGSSNIWLSLRSRKRRFANSHTGSGNRSNLYQLGIRQQSIISWALNIWVTSRKCICGDDWVLLSVS